MSNHPFQLDGKVALVTGGAQGIGAACARTLGGAGAKIMITDIQDEAGRAQVEALKSSGVSADFVLHDVGDEAQWESVIAQTIEKFGGLDILVNNAGIELMAPITDTTLEDWQRVQRVNVEGVFLGMKHAIREMRPDGKSGRGGSIVNLSSIAGLVGTTGLSAYCASKGAVRMMSKSAAAECGQLGYGIRVNSVHPGLIQTAMLDRLFDELIRYGAAPDDEAARAMFFAAQPMSDARLEPDDIANVVLFLASDASRHVTGSEYVCDAGFTAI